MSSPSEKESNDSRAQAIVEDVIARRRKGEVIADEQVLEQHPELLGTLEGLLRKAAFLELTRSSANHQSAPLENLLDQLESDPELSESDQRSKETPVQDILVSPTPAPPPPPTPSPSLEEAEAEERTAGPDYRASKPPSPPVPVDDWESLDIPLDDGLLDYSSFNQRAESAKGPSVNDSDEPANAQAPAPQPEPPQPEPAADPDPPAEPAAVTIPEPPAAPQPEPKATPPDTARPPDPPVTKPRATEATQPQPLELQSSESQPPESQPPEPQAPETQPVAAKKSPPAELTAAEPAASSSVDRQQTEREAQAEAEAKALAEAQLPRITIDEDSGDGVDAESHLDVPPPVDEPSTTVQNAASDESGGGYGGQTVVGIGPVRPGVNIDDEPTARLDQSPGFGDTARYRPTSRPPTAVLRVFDDNQTSGELVRIRKTDVTIGREKGDIVVGHDHQMSSRHARIERSCEEDVWRWVLRDLNSTNGVFVKARRIRLRDGDQLLIANRAVQFQQGTESKPTCLQEIRSKGQGERLELQGEDCWIGRDRSLCTPFLADEPTLDDRFARMLHRADGRWTIWSTQTLNGLWVRVDHITLVGGSMFQLGEQRFSFHTP